MAEEELDPRIQLELEKLNTETAEINKLELELEEANTTFRMLLNEATRRLKGLAQRLGNSVDRARPYHDALNAAQEARAACQRAAVAYQRASEIHAAAKETVALAEQRFKSNQHEWQFDSAWQDMLNHATIKVMDAENQKSESGREHHKRAQLFNLAETKLQQLEDQLKKFVIKSRPYFDEKQLCQEQLATQKERIEYLQDLISKAKFRYSQSLKTLETISEEIHMKRRDTYDDGGGEYPVGPREPGVGAENYTDYSLELEMNDLGLRKFSTDADNDETGTLEELRRHVRRLAARPVEGGERGDIAWETELNETVNRLDQMLMMRERAQQAKSRELNRNSPKAFNYAQDYGNSSNFENKSQIQSQESAIKENHLPLQQVDCEEEPKSNTSQEPDSYIPFEDSLPSKNSQPEICSVDTSEKLGLNNETDPEFTSNTVLENPIGDEQLTLTIDKVSSSEITVTDDQKVDEMIENETVTVLDESDIVSLQEKNQLGQEKLIFKPFPYTITFDDIPSNNVSENSNTNSENVMIKAESDNKSLSAEIPLVEQEIFVDKSSVSEVVYFKDSDSSTINKSDFKERVILDINDDVD